MDEKRFHRHMEKAKRWTMQTLKKKTAAELQKAVRAEAGAFIGMVKCVMDGQLTTKHSPLGQAICITCGALKDWKGNKLNGIDGMDAGHFLSSRRNSILLEEIGLHPQCTHCNRTGGRPEAYRIYMLKVYGQDVIDELQRLKNQESVTFEREELVRKRLSYMDRSKAAIKRMES